VSGLSSLALARSPCGGVRLRLAQTAVVMRASGALVIEQARMLVVADLHLEKGSAYAAGGQMLPPYDTAETLRRLAAEVAATAPQVLVFLGDTFHDGEGEGRLSPADDASLCALARGLTLIWVVGNHDKEGPRRLPGDVAFELEAAGLRLRHEPAIGREPGELSGHLHPCARITGVGRRRCFATDGERVVLPAFGAYAGGLNVRDAAFGGLFARKPTAVTLGPQRAEAVAWASLVRD
jgi:DNA ligase-associated metallophosphoesterase